MNKVRLPRMTGYLFDGTVYVVENVFSGSSKETAKDKLKRLILNNIPSENDPEKAELFAELPKHETVEIAELHNYIANASYTLDDLNAELYAIPKRVYSDVTDQKELKAIQGKFFKTVYKLLIDKEQGPRLYLFLYAINKEDYIGLLDFSYPATEEELAPPVEETVEVEDTTAVEETAEVEETTEETTVADEQ